MNKAIKAGLDTVTEGLRSLATLREDKRQYRKYLERVKALPAEYQFVYRKMTDYMWSYSGGGNGYDMIALQSDLLELFEAGTAEGKPVLELTGEDIAAFCDELLRNAVTYTEKRREKLNREILEKLPPHHLN